MSFLTWLASKLHFRQIPYMDDAGNNINGLRRFGYKPYVPKLERGNLAYLHNFQSPDFDGHHNHPWRWSFSIVLKGGYTEERLLCNDCGVHPCRDPLVEVRKVRWFNVLRSHDYHKITELHGDTWTLFICGPLTGRSWGFWMPGRGHIHWQKRLEERRLM